MRNRQPASMLPHLPRLVPLALLALLVPPAFSQASRVLHSGDQVDLRGTLVIKRRGWSEFLVLHTATPYTLAPMDVPDAPKEASSREPVQEIGITLSGQDDLLARSAGKPIRVSGRLQLVDASPFLWNSTLLWATAVALPTGDYVSPRLPEPGLPLTVHHYVASATLQPRLWPRLYTARDVDTHRPLSTPNLAGCRVSGAGDMLNCSCSDGFRPAGGVLHAITGTSPALMTGAFAQFTLPPPADIPVTADVECTRSAPQNLKSKD